MTNEIFQQAFYVISENILSLYNAYLKHKYFPDFWKIANVKLLKKVVKEPTDVSIF
jgi:hypothetical protein